MKTGRYILTLLLAALLIGGCLTCAAAADVPAEAEQTGDGVLYRLQEEDGLVQFEMDETPLSAAAPESCCVLHFILMVCALGVTVYFTYDRKTRQSRIFELQQAIID